jgi:hypothetical protein
LKKKDLGDEYRLREVTPLRGYEEREGKKEEVVRLVVAEPDIAFTPFFFYTMELILRNFNMKGTVEAILEGLEDYDQIRTLKLKYKDGDDNFEELVFGAKFLAFLDWVMVCTGSTPGLKGNYPGNDGGAKFQELVKRYKKKNVQTIDDKEVTTFPWVEAFHDQWIGLLKTVKKDQTVSEMKGGIDEDDRVVSTRGAD